MKKYLSPIVLLFVCATSYSQIKGTVFFANDTLDGALIAGAKKKTNHTQVTFSFRGNTRTFPSKEVAAFWKGKNYFRSYPMEDGSFSFINILLPGPCMFGKIVNQLGEVKFVFKEKEEGFFRLLEEEADPNEFFQRFLPSYEDFSKEYGGQITYDQKSLGKLVSSYNEFINPEKYKFTSLKHHRTVRFGLSFSMDQSKIILDGDTFLEGLGQQYGVLARYTLAPSIAVDFRLGLGNLSIEELPKSISLSSFRFESWVPVKFYKSRKIGISLAPGVQFAFNSSNSTITGIGAQSGTFIDSRRVEALSSGTSINLVVDFTTRKAKTMSFFVGRSSAGLKQRIDTLGAALSGVKDQDGKINMIRFGLNTIF